MFILYEEGKLIKNQIIIERVEKEFEALCFSKTVLMNIKTHLLIYEHGLSFSNIEAGDTNHLFKVWEEYLIFELMLSNYLHYLPLEIDYFANELDTEIAQQLWDYTPNIPVLSKRVNELLFLLNKEIEEIAQLYNLTCKIEDFNSTMQYFK